MNRVGKWSGRIASGLAIPAMLFLTACYSLKPMQSELPTPDKREWVAVILNDRGRALLADQVGAMTERVEGRVEEQGSDGTLVVSVKKVVTIKGDITNWLGEKVLIPKDAVFGYRERKLSKIKTTFLVGGIVAAVAMTLRVSLDIFGVNEVEPPGPPPDET